MTDIIEIITPQRAPTVIEIGTEAPPEAIEVVMPGTPGARGAKGDKGDQGIQGIQGIQGVQGIQGFKGDKGEQGIQGLKGDKGEQGVQGFKGDKGDQGIPGPIGPAGGTVSPALTGTPTAPTAPASDNSTILATTGHVKAAIAAANLAPAVHKHAIADVNGLQAALDARAVPDRLGAKASQNFTDWNECVDNGWYMNSKAANAPLSGEIWFLGHVQAHGGAGYCTQIVHAFANYDNSNTQTYRRQQQGGTWSTWARVLMTQTELDARFPQLAHKHAVADVNGLQTALDAKAPTASPTFSGTVTAPKVNMGASWGGQNWLGLGNGDAASYTTFNMEMRGWFGLGMSTYDGTVNGFYDFRAGKWDTKGGFFKNGVEAVYRDGGSYNINITGAALSANKLIRKDGGAAMIFDWSGQAGQPSWLWGGNDGTNMFVYSPANFNVNYASSAGNADTVDGLHAASFLRGDTTNGSVRMTPGDGNGIKFWDGDIYSICMSSKGNTTWGGDLNGGSDYNMYFRMGGGAARGFVFKNDAVGPIVQFTGAGDILAKGALFLGGGTNGARMGIDGNIYMPWAGDWISNVLGGKAAANHTHTIANITSLQTTLDSKQAALGYVPVNRAGDVMSGPLEIKSDDASFWIQKPSVKRAKWTVDGNGTLIWQDQGGQNHFWIGANGAIWTQQFGDVYTQIENRASAWGAAHAANCVTSSQMAGYTQTQPGPGAGNWQNSGYVLALVNRVSADSWLFGARQPQLYVQNRGWFAAFPFS